MEPVDLLTRRMPERESHNQYMDRLVHSGNVQALRVKLADVYDNMSPARTRNLPPADRGMRHRFARDAERPARRAERARRRTASDNRGR